MSALDQAFIKAYRQQVSPAAASAAAAAQRVSLTEAVEERRPAAPRGPSRENVLAALESPPEPAAGPAFQPKLYQGPSTADRAEDLDEANDEGDGAEDGSQRTARAAVALKPATTTPRRGAKRENRRAPFGPPTLGGDDLAGVIPLYRPEEDASDHQPDQAADAPGAADAPTEESTYAEQCEAAVAPAPCVEQAPEPAAADNSGPSPPPLRLAHVEEEAAEAARDGSGWIPPTGERDTIPTPPALPERAAPFQPMLQVDSFSWPAVCRRLGALAGDEIERLADWFVEAHRLGRRVVGVGARGRGEGATTVLLAAAGRLASRGLRIALVDADLAEPQLAQRLGLLPPAGWEAALTGRMTLADVTIESVEDRMVLLPTREPFGGAGVPLGHEAAIAGSLRTLAAAYDLVLVDLGPLGGRAAAESAPYRGIGPSLDGVVLVRNVRSTAAGHLDETRLALRAAGIAPLGVVENLVRAG